VWAAVDMLFRDDSKVLVRHQIDSFNAFVRSSMHDIIAGFNPIDVPYHYNATQACHDIVIRLEMQNPVIMRPLVSEKDGTVHCMYPNTARNRNFTYSSSLFVDLAVSVSVLVPARDAATPSSYRTQTKTFPRVPIAKIPIMIGSDYCASSSSSTAILDGDECPFDVGGYFIINGAEKVIISQDRVQENKTFVFPSTKSSTYSHVAEIRSVTDNVCSPPKMTTLRLSARPNDYGRYIRVSMHHVKTELPLFVLFRALGVETDKAIIGLITYNDPAERDMLAELRGCVLDAQDVRTQPAAMAFIAQNMSVGRDAANANPAARLAFLRDVIERELLPHTGSNLVGKAVYLGYMARRLLATGMGAARPDDRDSYINKRVDTPGMLLANIFRQYYGKMVKDAKKMLLKELHAAGAFNTSGIDNVVNKHNLARIIKSTIVESGLKYALSTGVWGLKTSRATKVGVAQILNRMTYAATLSHLRRVNTPMDKSGKLVQPRRLHATQWGIICPAETPEGISVGAVKNMAMLTHVTCHTDSSAARAIVRATGLVPCDVLTPGELKSSCKVFINGHLMGVVARGEETFGALKLAKLSGRLDAYTSVVWSRLAGSIEVSTEAGRCCRPLLVVRDGRLNLGLYGAGGGNTWCDLMWRADGRAAVEYLDVAESNSSLIAVDPMAVGAQHTHSEIHPSLILGVLAATIPFSDHNQSPRNAYQSAMGKQAIGVFTTNFRNRFDVLAHILNSPERPLVSTKASDYLRVNTLPNGTNCIVAIACFTGFNQEDAIIANRTSVERGLLTSTFFRTIKEQNNKNHSTGEEEFFCNPQHSAAMHLKSNNYDKVASDGFVPVNTYVTENDILIGKCMPYKAGGKIELRDASVSMKAGECGWVDRNSLHGCDMTTNGDGYDFCKLRVRSYRAPVVGDKMSCYTGDHDVLTDNGWVPIGRLCTFDKVATLVDGRLLYQNPSALQSYRCGEFDTTIEILHEHVSLRVTRNHRMYVGSGGSAGYGMAPAHLAMCGSMYYASGLDDGWGPGPATGREDADTYRVMTIDLNAEGPLPRWVWELSPRVSHMLLIRMLTQLQTMDGGRADEAQRLALHGFAACAKVPVGRGRYRVEQIPSQSLVTAACYVELPAPADGRVYCCTVPLGEGVIYVRRRGLPVWSGNSRMGQKGTIGIMYPQHDMPFTASGIVPDIIINPHAIPSRMTVGQLLECVLGKACCVKGCYGDATPFGHFSAEEMVEQLRQCGFEGYGNEVMYDGRTGQQVQSSIFIGPTFYQRLKHMVCDKVHSRNANGPVVMLTRQPAEGRSNRGGLRIGEMEAECNSAHGTFMFLKERFVDCSDNFRIFMCNRCHSVATASPEDGGSSYLCTPCRNTSDFSQVRIPFAFKLMSQELQSLGIGMKLNTL
jgi:DNA-directed RNA polymerase II subunit RPB2